MIKFLLNGESIDYDGDLKGNLLHYLRKEKLLTAAKNGCSGEGSCGACLIEFNGKPRLACKTSMDETSKAEINTLEGIPESVRKIIATSFVNRGAVQCGFCTPGFVMRTHILLKNNPYPTHKDIQEAINGHHCRCTGYKKVEAAIAESALQLTGKHPVEKLNPSGPIGTSTPKYKAMEAATGKQLFVDDMHFDGMLYGALLFSAHPRAKIKTINTRIAKGMPGVKAVLTERDIPGTRFTGQYYKDWPLMISVGETTHFTGDVLAGVVAETEQQAREAITKIEVSYDVLPPITTTEEALVPKGPQVHRKKSNLVETAKHYQGEPDKALKEADFVISGKYSTQRVEHAYLETESAIALWEKGGITLYSAGQGIYKDRHHVARLLNMREKRVRVIHVPTGGAFGGKEDFSVQGHAALFAKLLKAPVKFTLTRQESIRMHPKRIPVTIDITLACDGNGMLTAIKMRATGDTGAYASIGSRVMDRIASHATGGYYIPNIDVQAFTVYSNNAPSGAMRGSGASQAVFALESCIDELCHMSEFDRWQFRYDNALTEGLTTGSGDHVRSVGIIECLEAIKDKYYQHRFTGIACAIKSNGVGNGVKDYADTIIEIVSPQKVILHHGWSEMGQGIHTIATQVLCKETGINPEIVEILVDTQSGIKTGMTTASRETVLLGNAIIDACKKLKKDLKKNNLEKLSGRKYKGRWECHWTRKPWIRKRNAVTHYSYGYAAQLVVLDSEGAIEKIYSAQDAGKIINPIIFEGQVEGAIHMGLGYALSEEIITENGVIQNTKLSDCKILTAKQTPEIEIIPIEVPDPVGPYGSKAIEETSVVPVAAAVSNAFAQFDNIRRHKLPLEPIAHPKLP